MIKYSISAFLFFFFSCVYAQTMLSGVVNVYSGLIAQNNCLNTIEINNTTGFQEGMGLLIIQINGASIQSSDNENFGNITDLNGAGEYEYNRISQIDGQTITLEKSLQNDYSPSHSQVVGFDIHADVIISGEINAPTWNGNTGGIIVIESENSVELQADVNANGLGFRGGQSFLASDDNCNFLTNSNNFSYEEGNWRGSPKGEGIAAFISGAENGRGAQANGGGGGNSHNSGGGGGALLTQGGIGGNNDEPSFLGCDGNFPGRGGKILPLNPSYIFFGGGGGTGHSNNNTETRGGAGGGIIIIKSTEIQFNGGQLLSNGQDGQSVSGDGGGGGGAGGTILLNATTITGNIAISAQGGNGGHADNDGAERCFGPGGGGSGGLLLSGQNLIAQLNGGLPGQTTNSASCTGSNGAMAGEAGIQNETLSALIQGEVFMTPSFTFSSPDTVHCAGVALTLFATVDGEDLTYQWQFLDDDNNWIDLADGAIFSGSQSLHLTIESAPDIAGSYRLLASPEDMDCLLPFNSTPTEVTIESLPTAVPNFVIDGFDVQFMANAEDYSTVSWTFLDNENSTDINPSFSFSEAGLYSVEFQASNDCGQFMTTLMVEIAAPLIAQFSSSTLSGCAPLNVLFNDTSIGEFDERTWTFEGGIPATSTEEEPLVQFPEPGSYEVSLSIQNSSNSNTISTTINAFPPPIPNFTLETDGLNVLFTNTSTNAATYFWNFGDNESSMDESPIHTYATSGIYEVTLNAVNENCGTALSQTIDVNITNINDFEFTDIIVYPNPGEGLFHINYKEKGLYYIYDINGHLIRHDETNSGSMTVLDLSTAPSGLYFLVMEQQGKLFRTRIVKL